MTETIKQLTDLMADIHTAYYKGQLGLRNGDDTGGDGCICGELWVHESGDTRRGPISIDLYHFGGDGLPVCDGLKPCTITFEDESHDMGWLFCMCYNPKDERKLVFLLSHDEYSDGGDIDVNPECVPSKTLEKIYQWLKGQFPNNN